MSDTVQSYFDTGVAFLNRRQNSTVIMDEAEQKRLFGIFCRSSKSENQILELMYRYFKCMNGLAGTNARTNEILLFISELYLINENVIGSDIQGFCEEYLNHFKKSKSSMDDLKKEIQTYFRQNGYNGVKRQDVIPVNGEIGKIQALLNEAGIEYEMDEVLSAFASENTMALNLHRIPIRIYHRDIKRLDKVMQENGYSKDNKKIVGYNYKIPGTNTFIEFTELDKTLDNIDGDIETEPAINTETPSNEQLNNIVGTDLDKGTSRKLIINNNSGFLSLKAIFVTVSIIGIGLVIANVFLIK